ncbi:MAG: protein kinase, partial [Candidatus Hydrogenedentes bacterium]|nr:protein kinase [Candidatus Hydrogenedentota bacterium]
MGAQIEFQQGTYILDHYRIEALLGEGGMGRVYKAYHTLWNKSIVIKVPKLSEAAGVAERLQFERECDNWIRLGVHPHIASCYFVRHLDDVPLIFAEFVPGRTVYEWIDTKRLYQDGGRRAFGRILDIAIQSAWALHFAHMSKTVHGDVKPANLIVGPYRSVKLVDFGIARAYTQLTRKKEETHQSLPSGMTPAYASPEQLDGKELSPASDIWSWGLTVLEMLIGERRWMSGVMAPEILEDVLRGASTAKAGTVLPRIPDELADVLRQCFAQDPRKRPATLIHATRQLQSVYARVMKREHIRIEPPNWQVGDQYETLANVNNRAASYLELGKIKEADALWRDKLGTSDPLLGLEDANASEDIYYNYTLLQIRSNPIFDVHAQLERMPTGTNPLRSALYKGVLYLEAGEFAKALAILRTPSRTDHPLAIEALNARGVAYVVTGGLYPAIYCFKRALWQKPADPVSLRNLATTLYYSKQYYRAMRCFERLADICALTDQDRVRQATVYAACGYRKGAESLLATIANKDSLSPDLLLTLAELRMGAGTFLPGISRELQFDARVDELVLAADEKEPMDLRMRVDKYRKGMPYALRPCSEIDRRRRTMPNSDDGLSIADAVSAGFAPLQPANRWGISENDRMWTPARSFASIAAILLTFPIWSRVFTSTTIEQFTGLPGLIPKLGVWFASLILIASIFLRRKPASSLLGSTVCIYVGIPFVAFLPTMGHYLSQSWTSGFFAERIVLQFVFLVKFSALFSLMFVIWESLYRYLVVAEVADLQTVDQREFSVGAIRDFVKSVPERVSAYRNRNKSRNEKT